MNLKNKLVFCLIVAGAAGLVNAMAPARGTSEPRRTIVGDEGVVLNLTASEEIKQRQKWADTMRKNLATAKTAAERENLKQGIAEQEEEIKALREQMKLKK